MLCEYIYLPVYLTIFSMTMLYIISVSLPSIMYNNTCSKTALLNVNILPSALNGGKISLQLASVALFIFERKITNCIYKW